MCKIKLVFIFLSVFHISNAQILPLESKDDYSEDEKAGKYVKDLNDDLLPLEGTWQASSPLQTFRLELRRVKLEASGPDDYSEDILAGDYSLVENGNTQVNSIDNNYPNVFNRDFLITVRANHIQETNTVEYLAFVVDPREQSVFWVVDLEYVPSSISINGPSGEKLIWDLQYPSVITMDTTTPIDDELRLPQYLELTR
jgi:hypothetical protein